MESVTAEEVAFTDTLDLRYRGQSHTLEIAWSGALAGTTEAFHRAHEHRYGHHLDLPVELVTLRVRAQAPEPELVLPERPDGKDAAPAGTQRVHGSEREVPVYRMSALARGQRLQGPVLVAADDSTLWLTAGWQAVVDRWGNLLLERR
jgi:N-methylhydantoinase A